MSNAPSPPAPKPPKPPEKGTRPLVRDYALVAVVAQVIVFLILFVEGPGLWAILPVSIGLMGVLIRWGSAPAIFLLLLTLLIVVHPLLVSLPMNYRPPGSGLIDVVLAMAVLAYTAAQSRLVTLTSHGVPPDRRRSRKPLAGRIAGRWLLPGESPKRSEGRVLSLELILLLIAVPGFAILAAILYEPLSREFSPFRGMFSDGVWQLFFVLWAMCTVLLVARGLLGYLGRAKASRDESLLYLQDQAWMATRGEQRKIAQWLTWGRMKRQQK